MEPAVNSGAQELPTPVARPVLRWAGGKTRLLGEIHARLPDGIQGHRLVEPFVGGGAVFFSLSPARALLADINEDLITVYCTIRDNAARLMVYLEDLGANHSPDTYYAVRDRFNQRLHADYVERAAQFVYLNKTNFNGLWRVTKDGKYNVPLGRQSRVNVLDEAAIKAASIALSGTDLIAAHYSRTLGECSEGDFVYVDPPYVPVNADSFTEYAKGGFDAGEHEDLWSACVAAGRRGAKVLISNASCSYTRELYARRGWTIDTVGNNRSVAADPTKRGTVTELLVRNY